MESDERLARLARAGHAAAFEAIVERYRRPLLAYCRRLLPDSRAEDAVQQTFLSAYRALPRAGDVQLRAWLYRIAHNAAVDALRRPGWDDAQLDPRVDGVARPDQVVLRRERFDQVIAAVRNLPPRQRDAIVLRELEGRSHEQIAAELGLTAGAARQLIGRARANVRRAMAALLPPGLIERVLAAPGGSDPRVAELATGGVLATGAAKAGVAALATGVVVVGGMGIPTRSSEQRAAAPPASPTAVQPHPEARAAAAPGARANPERPDREATAVRPASEDTERTRARSPGGDRDDDSGPDEQSGPDDREPRGGDDSGEDRAPPETTDPEAEPDPETEAPEQAELETDEQAPNAEAPDRDQELGEEPQEDLTAAPAGEPTNEK